MRTEEKLSAILYKIAAGEGRTGVEAFYLTYQVNLITWTSLALPCASFIEFLPAPAG